MTRKPFAVRFAPNVIAAVRSFASSDGLTVSEWVRRLVEKELKNAHRPVDVGKYPQAQTVSSGAGVQVQWTIAPSGHGTRTGY